MKTLNILMNGMQVGLLEKNSHSGLSFTYDNDWLNSPDSRPVSLSMPLMQQRYTGDIVYHFFDNLLPDNPAMRSQIQAFFNIPSSHPFDLLAVIGKDCVGAIQITENENSTFKKQILCEPLTKKEIAEILRNIKKYPLGMSDTDSFRISIAGAQEKTALLYWNNQWNRPLGTTPSTHIFKLPIGVIPHQNIDLSNSCENEWLCAQIAEAFGLPVASCEIKNFEEVKTLIVERFDRKLSQDGKWLMRLPQEDMCQALGISPNLKYQSDGGPGIKNIMQLLLGAMDAASARHLFFRAQILFWLLAAIDGHAKNFSLHIAAKGRYQLAPLYDIISAYPLITNKELQANKIKMAMALEGANKHYHWHNIQRRHFLQTAKNANYSASIAESILNEMLEKVDWVIKQVSSKLPAKFPQEISQPIFDGLILMRNQLS